MLFHLPVLSKPDLLLFRGPGPGLGNLLFPLSRAYLGQKSLGGKLVIPTFRQLKLGTFLRGERDKRTYGDIFQQRTLSDYYNWVASLLQAKSCEGESQYSYGETITYTGMGNQFHDLQGYYSDVRDFLIGRSKLKSFVKSYDIAIHVRRGDFQADSYSANVQNFSIPIDWYKKALDYAIQISETKSPKIILFTDAEPGSLLQELGRFDVTAEPSTNALVSMLNMSKARIIIGSRSTFSLWGNYLGNNIAIWPSQFDLGRYKPISKRDIFI